MSRRSTRTGGHEAPSPRSPVEVLDDLIEGRRHPSSAEASLEWEHHRPDHDQRIRGFQRQGGSLAPTGRHRGRAASWVVVALALVGFTLGGIAVAQGMTVWLSIVAGVFLVAAVVLAAVTDIFSDVVLDSPSVEPEEPHDTSLRRLREEQRLRRERRAGRS
ncbi:hypothetical protein PWG71_06385 [Nocardiopsis sp. N85]|uniref:hypothetical protein n=1 Tax=Nocardiopsis sp. N85 TaxID=3029400 RepID=UPI00237F5459|nr:hypothetical protein [Nocardiopsis sp. N85]MDE3721010.1 hypothetical protein [Nocardiopsis sp. N85]